MRERTFLLLAVACVFLAGSTASAACTISVGGVAFGSYDVFRPTPLDSTGSIVFECDKQDKRIRITLSTGISGTYAARAMRNGTEVLTYNLFINTFTTVWGDGSGGTGYYWHNNPPNNRPVNLTIYGRVPALQDVRPGSYSDNIQVAIDF